MLCVHQSGNGMCVASCSSLSLAASLFLGPPLTLQSAVPSSPSPPTTFSFLVCHRILAFFQTVQLLLCMTFCTSTAVLCPLFYGFSCDTRATLCSCQLKTKPVSSRHIHISMVISLVSSCTAFSSCSNSPWCSLPQCVMFSHSSSKL